MLRPREENPNRPCCALFPETERWLTDLERRQTVAPGPPADPEEARLDEEDLTKDPALAGADSDTSGDTGCDSDGSLPAGPPVSKRRRQTPPVLRPTGAAQTHPLAPAQPLSLAQHVPVFGFVA